jgi:hypothetical protein
VSQWQIFARHDLLQVVISSVIVPRGTFLSSFQGDLLVMTLKYDINKQVSVASAVALAIGASAAMAATLSVNGTPENISTDGAATATAGVAVSLAAQPQITIGTDFEVGDQLVVTVAGATVATSGTPAMTCSSPLTSVVFASRTTSALTFQVQVDAGSPTSSSNGAVCTVAGLRVDANSLTTAGAVTYTFKGVRSTTSADIDVTNTATTLATKRAQFALASTGNFNGIVDYRSGKGLSFTDALTDSLVVSYTNRNTDTLAVPTDRLTLAVVADSGLSFLNNSANTTCTSGSLSAAGLVGAANTFTAVASSSSSCSTINVTVTNGTAILTDNITLTVGKTAASTTRISPQSFTLSSAAVRNSTSSASIALTDTSAGIGSWTQNASRITVPYIPYGTGSSRVLYITNRGDVSGAVTFDLIADGTGLACTAVGTAAAVTASAAKVTVISSQFDAAVRECYGSSFTGKVAAIVNVAAPAQDVELFSMYNSGGTSASRVVVPNSSNGRKSSSTLGADYTE